MIKFSEQKTAAVFSLSIFMLVGYAFALPTLAIGDGDAVDAQFQTTGTVVLKQSLRAGDFMLLKDITPLQIVGGHVAMKVPCDGEGETPLQILAGSASEAGSTLVEVELEFIEDVSNPGRDCVFHADLDGDKIKSDLLAEAGKEVNITDIVLANPGSRRVFFGNDNSNTVTVNLLISSGSEEEET